MRIDHIAIWTTDLERCAAFYATYFGATAGPPYINATKGFQSRFLTFDDGARIEVMTTTTLNPVAIQLIKNLEEAGIVIVDGPRRTGDGYYESVILDPDGNRVEVTS